jgi:hypothetical protein
MFNNLSLISFNIILIFTFILLTGCGTDEQFEDQNTVPLVDSSWFTALDFPTADGDSWEYVNSDGNLYTSKIAGIKNISGSVVRILESNSDIPVDYTGASYGFPVRNYMFTKDLDQYKEYAFELWVDFLNDTYFQRYLPERIAWSFPLYKGKKWTVTKLYTEPAFIYTRKVVSAKESITVPAGNFTQVFVVEESVSTDIQPDLGVVSTYWLAKGIGIIKYQYLDPSTISTITFELSKFTDN